MMIKIKMMKRAAINFVCGILVLLVGVIVYFFREKMIFMLKGEFFYYGGVFLLVLIFMVVLTQLVAVEIIAKETAEFICSFSSFFISLIAMYSIIKNLM